jgi:hypothetical protein
MAEAGLNKTTTTKKKNGGMQYTYFLNILLSNLYLYDLHLHIAGTDNFKCFVILVTEMSTKNS